MPRLPLDGLLETIAQRRANRRTALAGGLASALTLAGAKLARAQDATPAATDDTAYPMFLYVQLAEGGAWTQSDDDPEIYELALYGIASQTAYFSDRPERIVGTMETVNFLEMLGFTPVNPPNAAAVVRTPEGERDVLVIELFDPVYSRTFGEDAEASLTYRARVLDAYHGDDLESWYDEQDDPELPSQFDQVSLFIDDCPDISRCILQFGVTPRNGTYDQGPVPGGPYRGCPDFDEGVCYACGSSWDAMAALCNATYPDCMDRCWALG
jgi:hypothetical protein